MIDDIILADVQRIKDGVALDFFNGENVLVAGGAGFIGSYLCDVLVEFGSNVTCLDNFSTGLIENVDHLVGRKKFRLIRRDVSKFDGKEKYEYILHFASRASPEEYQLHPIETLLANSFGNYKMLELARKHDSRILFASSSEVYGDAEVIPTPETYWGNVNPVGVRSCYDEGKRFGEALFMAFYREYGLDTRIVRLHNTYGPRIRAVGNYARVVPRFIFQALKGEDLSVYGEGSQTRSFCYVTDSVLGILLALNREKANGEVINVGNPYEISILDLAKKIKAMVRSSSKLTFHPLPKDDPRRRCPDISRAREILGWEPKVSLEDGLKRTIDWFQNFGVLNEEGS